MQLSLRSMLSSLEEGAPLQTFLLLFAILLILARYLQNWWQYRSYPPGPPTLPLLGNFLYLDVNKPHISMQKLVKKYGNVIYMHLGNFKFVMITGMPLIKEVLVNQDQVFIDRPILPLQYHAFKPLGLVTSSGQKWKHQRRFALTTLRNFGLGKRTLEDRIREEAQYLTEALSEEKGQPFDPHFQINNAVSNIICSITFGHRFEYYDSRFRELLKILDDITVLSTAWEAQLFNMFPGIMKFLPGSHQKLFKEWEKLECFVEEVIKQHKENLNPEETLDFIDAYLKEMPKFKDDILNEKNLIYCTLDLFIAGTETTSTTLRWALLYMALNSEIQEKIQVEIDTVIGQSRLPTMADKEKLHYTYAAVHEVQRMGNSLPFNVARMTTVDTTLAGYHVPKGTAVLTNLTDLFRDPKEWATPETFNPEHFLENGQFKKRESFMPFSIGKRACLGEQLARTELFLFFTCLLQKFTFQAPPNTQLTLDFRAGATFSPASYKICALPRVM